MAPKWATVAQLDTKVADLNAKLTEQDLAIAQLQAQMAELTAVSPTDGVIYPVVGDE